MDVPDNLDWDGLCKLAEDRVGWRSRVWALRDKSTTDTGVTITINPFLPGSHSYNTRSKSTPPTPSATPSPSPSKLMARKYRQRDVHAMFFAGVIGRKRKCKVIPPKSKKICMTTPQRAAFARAHYEKHHGLQSKLLEHTPPKILGHHQHHHPSPSPDSTLPFTPTNFKEMFHIIANREEDQQNLQNFSTLTM